MSDAWMRAAAAALMVTAVALAGCGGESSSGGGESASSGGPSVNTAAASQAIAEYTGKPTAFPVDLPLKTKPAGKTFAYLQCSTPACALFAQLLEPTQQLLGYQLKVVKAGASATEVQNAMNSIVALKPDGVLLPGADPNQFLAQLKQLQAAKIPISANAIIDPAKYGLEADFINNHTNELAGKLMADWAVTQGGGEVAFYGVPELSFSPVVRTGFDASSRSCARPARPATSTSRSATIGKTRAEPRRLRPAGAPEHEGRRLRHRRGRHRPARRAEGRAAGREADRLRAAARDPRLHQAGPVGRGGRRRRLHDASGRRSTRSRGWWPASPLTAGQKQGLPPIQILTKRDITFDPTQGWKAYPDFAEHFAQLWGATR